MKLATIPDPLQSRIKGPTKRGRLTREDAAESRLGLVSAGNAEGRIYLLVDPAELTIEKARFLAYGKLESILAFDAICVLAEGRRLPELTLLSDVEMLEEIGMESELDFSWKEDLLSGIQDLEVQVEDPSADAPKIYKRKDKEDMNEQDLAWLPLSAPIKIAKVQEVVDAVIPERTNLPATAVEIFNVKRDLLVQLRFSDEVAPAQQPLLLQFVQEACRSALHPEVNVEEVEG